jgi:hypothetical protein
MKSPIEEYIIKEIGGIYGGMITIIGIVSIIRMYGNMKEEEGEIVEIRDNLDKL